MKKLGIILILICCPLFGWAQLDSIQRLDEVVLSDVKLKKLRVSHKLTVLTDSILNQQPANSTNFFSFNTNIYFNENGFGMVSSPSFRGTNASQTAVLWNGININSQLNGQTDFGALSLVSFDNITVKSGGGSVQHGSGAIGGSIHLNNNLDFSSVFKNTLQLSYASFNTKQLTYKAQASTKRLALSLGINRVSSDNDYKFIGKDQNNTNGAFNNSTFSANLGYTISKTDILKFYTNTFIGERELSATLVAPSKSKYNDTHFRHLLEWQHIGKNYTSALKFAALNETFKYFENKENNNFSVGEVQQYITKHEFEYRLPNNITLNSVLEYNTFNGEGSNFGNPSRNAFSATLILQQKIKKFVYNLSARQDITTGFTSPLIFSADANYKFSKHYMVTLNASKNYRVPTFNDLYWQPGGNLDLVPETSYQTDFGQSLTFKSVQFLLNAYYIRINDMIQWTPENGFWSPKNINEVESLGAEFETSMSKKISNHNLKADLKYSFTSSRNLKDNKQLIYVPKHKGNFNLAYNYKHATIYFQQLYNGQVNIIGDVLKAYNVSNAGIGYKFKHLKNIDYSLNFKVNNLMNTYYENVALRPMPNRNYNLQLTLNF